MRSERSNVLPLRQRRPTIQPPIVGDSLSQTYQGGTSLLTPEQHRSIAARLQEGPSDDKLQFFARLHEKLAQVIENRQTQPGTSSPASGPQNTTPT